MTNQVKPTIAITMGIRLASGLRSSSRRWRVDNSMPIASRWFSGARPFCDTLRVHAPSLSTLSKSSLSKHGGRSLSKQGGRSPVWSAVQDRARSGVCEQEATKRIVRSDPRLTHEAVNWRSIAWCGQQSWQFRAKWTRSSRHRCTRSLCSRQATIGRDILSC